LGKTRRELVRSLDEDELGYWMALERIDGYWGDRRRDHNAAMIAMHNAAHACPGETFFLKDFLPGFGAECDRPVCQSDEEMQAEWTAAVAAFGRANGN
jgi:hypothetical protein